MNLGTLHSFNLLDSVLLYTETLEAELLRTEARHFTGAWAALGSATTPTYHDQQA